MIDLKKIEEIRKQCVLCNKYKMCEYRIREISIEAVGELSMAKVRQMLADMKKAGSVFICKDCAVLNKI